MPSFDATSTADPLLPPESAEGSAAGETLDPVAELLLRLMEVRSAADAARDVLGALRELSGAAWGAIYERGDDACRCAGSFGGRPSPPQALPLAAAEHLPAELVRPTSGAITAAAAPASTALAARFEGADGGPVIVLLGNPAGRPQPAPRAVETLRSLLPAFSAAFRLGAQFDALRSIAQLDPLTGCFNRRGFDEHLRVEISRARRYRRPLAMMVVDLDHFKTVNDERGHDVGDHVLREFGTILMRTFRATDRVCRFGGDEFAVIFPETPKGSVLQLAERLRGEIEAHFEDTRLRRTLTASFGVAGYPADAEDSEELLRAADQALYRAKSEGRNRVAAA